MKPLRLIAALLLLSHATLAAETGLRVAGVQLRIDESMYKNVESFSIAVERRLQRALNEFGDEHRVRLVVFPEYTSAFLALIPYAQQIESADTVAGAFAAIRGSNPAVKSIRDLLVEQAGWVEDVMDRVWGGLAKEYAVTILAGTYFADSAGGLRNRFVVYGENGRRIYEQDKVYLTEYEVDIIGLEPGSVGNAALYEIDGHLVATTICRDTFFSTWNRPLGKAVYWLDIKADGAEYVCEDTERLMSALPERIYETGVGGGMTVYLTGIFLDLFWEGRSFTVSHNTGHVRIDEFVETAVADALLFDEVKSATAR